MLNLPLPEYGPDLVYEAAKERFTDVDYKKRLSDGQNDVMSLCQEYVDKANNGHLHLIVGNPAVPPHILAGDMPTLYSQGLLRKRSEARTYYEKLRLSSPYRLCPLCLHRTVKTLDHYLPKAQYGAYAVLPANLIPCCRDCNSDKDVFAPEDRASTIIHPYFDNVDASAWLGCEIDKHADHCTVSFYINSVNVTEDLRPRLIAHMENLQLYELYDIEAAREINEMAGVLKTTFDASGLEAVKELCESMAASRSVLAANYWKAVLWRSAANDAEFCCLHWFAVSAAA